MSGVEFDTDRQAMIQKMQALNAMGSPAASSSKFAQWMITKGIVSTEAAAQKVMLGIVALNIIITIAIIVYIL
jgi:hypothetical protein